MLPNLMATLKQALFRWGNDGTTAFRLGQRRIFILPTRSGVLYALTLVVMLLTAINYSLALGHALVFFLAGLGLVGMLHTFRNLHGLLISPGRSPAVFAGESAHFELTLSNDRPEGRGALDFRIVGEPPEAAVITTVDAGQTAKIAIPVPALRRGWLELPRIRLRTDYPLGLFVAWSYLQPSMRCLVYPKPLSSPLPPPAQPLPTGSHHGESGQEDFSGFRLRQPSDSPRHVAWKSSARDDGQKPLLIKQFGGGGQAEYRFAWADLDPGLDTEERLSILSGWVLAASAAGQSFALQLPDSELPVGGGEAHTRRCLEALALTRP